MPKQTEGYTNREIEMMLNRFEEMFVEIKSTLKENNTRIDTEIKEIRLENKETRKEVQAIKDWQTRLMAIWGAIVFILGLVGQQILKIFTA